MGFKSWPYSPSSNNRAVPGTLQFLPLLCTENSLLSAQLLAASPGPWDTARGCCAVQSVHTHPHKAGHRPQKHMWLSPAAALSQQTAPRGELLLRCRRPMDALSVGEAGKNWGWLIRKIISYSVGLVRWAFSAQISKAGSSMSSQSIWSHPPYSTHDPFPFPQSAGLFAGGRTASL